MGNSPLSGQGVSEPHERDVQGVESTDGKPNKLAEKIRDNPSNPTPSHIHRVHPNESRFKILEKREHGRTQVLPMF